MSSTGAAYAGDTFLNLGGSKTLVKAADVPDDVWINIFESTDSPAAIAMLMRTCRKFNALGLRPLLGELRWVNIRSTKKNLQDWDPSSGMYKDLVIFPRKVTIGVSFDFASNIRNTANDLTREYEFDLCDWMYHQLPRFTSLTELALENTVISPYVYTVLAQIPGLRTLSVSNCSFMSRYTPFADRRHNAAYPSADLLENLPITQLSFHPRMNLGDHSLGPLHPLYLLMAKNLTSLSISWTPNVSSAYARHHGQWVLPNLMALEVVVPLLTRDLADTLIVFLGNCALRPRMKFVIEGHNVGEQGFGAGTTPVTIPMRGVWSYTGPLALVARQEEGTLTHMVMNEPLELAGVLRGMRRLPRCVEELELQVRKWDVEILFAVRELFPGIKRIVARYGSGTFPEDFLVTLGSNILFDLKQLRTIKVVQDRACTATSRRVHLDGGGFITTTSISDGVFPFSSSLSSASVSGWVLPRPLPFERPIDNVELEHADLRDYLVGWNRYCTALRVVQLGKESWWGRRFEGDPWRWIEAEVQKEPAEEDRYGDLDFY